ncbi:MAG: 16S rRNA (cytidine(1402)-2'-O)-methyltransferase [Hyphomicrobiaceae bacterium]
MTGDSETGDRGTGAAGKVELVVARAAQELQRRLQDPLPAGLYLVSTPIGNVGDMTLRALAVLAKADHVYCEDTRHSRPLLSHFGIDRALKPYHEHNARKERGPLLKLIADGKSVALISDAGTPLVSDPGYKLVLEAVEQGLLVQALPGASAVLCAIAVAGLPTDQFHFAGFLPVKQGQRRERIRLLGDQVATVVLFEAPNRLAALLDDIQAVLGDHRQVVVARELTKRFEEVKRGSAADVRAWAEGATVRGEVVVLIGPAPPAEVHDDDILSELEALGTDQGLKEASRQVAGKLGVSRSRVYDIGLQLKARRS